MLSDNLYYKWVDVLTKIIGERKLLQSDIANAIGVSGQHINNILTKRGRASQKVVEKISNYVGLSYEDFLASHGNVVKIMYSLSERFGNLIPYINSLTDVELSILTDLLVSFNRNRVSFSQHQC